MIKQYLSRLRSDAQLLGESRLTFRRGSYLINSIPKSGTHYIKSLMLGMNYEFRGHFNSRSIVPICLSDNGASFHTAHTRKKVSGVDRSILLIRDPIAVAKSLAHYAQSRKDHYRQQEFSGLEYDDVMLRIFSGTGAYSDLATRYKKMMEWATENNAYIIDYDDLKDDLTILQRFLNVESIDETKIVSELARWNPTKRKKNADHEKAFCSAFAEDHEIEIRDCYKCYAGMRQMRAYEV